MSIKQALQLGRMSEIAGYDVNEKDGMVNLVNMFDGSSTGWVTVDEAVAEWKEENEVIA